MIKRESPEKFFRLQTATNETDNRLFYAFLFAGLIIFGIVVVAIVYSKR